MYLPCKHACTCRALSCSQCIFQDHNGHQYKNVTDVYEQYKQELATEVDAAATLLARMDSLMAKFEERKDDVLAQKDRLEDRINSTVQQLQETLETKRSSLIHELQKLSSTKVTSLSEKKGEVNRWQVELKGCIEEGKSMLEDPSKETVILKRDRSVQFIKTACADCRQADLEIHEEANMDIIGNLETALQSINNLAAITTCNVTPSKCYARGNALSSADIGKLATVTVHVMNGKTRPCNEGCLSDVIFKLTSEDGNEITGTATRTSENRYEFSYTPIIKGYHELSITIREQHIYGSPFRVAVRSPIVSLGVRCRSITAVQSPCGVAVNRLGDVFAVSEEKQCITVMKQNGRLIQESADISRLVDVAVGDDNSIYAVTKYENKIVKLSPEGTVLSTTAKYGSGPLRFNSPMGIAFNSKNKKLYVSNTGNHEIQILNEDLSFHDVFGNEGSKKSQFNSPVGICCDSIGRVVVADSKNDRIQVFSTDGRFIRMFGHSGEKSGQLRCPLGVATDSCRQIYVSEGTNNRVSIFGPNGNFLRCFGEDGVMKKPCGIAVDSNCGTVLVCNYGHNLIQVY